jgi:N-methylhydantoinase B
MSKTDVVLTEIIRNRLVALTQEMAKTMVRTAFNPLLYEVQDFSVTIMSATGEMWAETPGVIVFSRTFPDAVRAGIRRWQGKFDDGDVLIANDPFETGTHISDTSVYVPIFFEGRLVAFCGVAAHWADIGGKNPGGWCPDTTDVYQEGICFRHQKLVAAGIRNEGLWDLIADNVRVPETVRGDLEAQLASCLQGTRGVHSLCAKYGAATVEGAMAQVIGATDRAMRTAIGRLPDGEWSASLRLDFDGIDPDGDFLICLKTTIEGERVRMSLHGSSPTARGPVNLPAPCSVGILSCVVKGILMPLDPTNDGHFHCVEIDLPPNSIINPSRPAPTDSYGYAVEVLTELTLRCFGHVLPERCPAGSYQLTFLGFARSADDRGPGFVVSDSVHGGNGAHCDADGQTLMLPGNGDLPINPVEVLETRYPIRLERVELIPDSAGAGTFRGGMGLTRQYRILADGASLNFVSENTKDPTSLGVDGGGDGKISRLVINPGAEDEALHTIRFAGYGPIPAGTVFRAQSGGGGGWGPPGERDPARVLADLRNEYVGEDEARQVYKVAARREGRNWVLDEAATARLRAL